MKLQPHATDLLLMPMPDESNIAEYTIAIVLIKIAGIIGEVSFKNVEPTVAIVIGNLNSHACLFLSVFAVCATRHCRYIGERPVMMVRNRMLGCESTAT